MIAVRIALESFIGCMLVRWVRCALLGTPAALRVALLGVALLISLPRLRRVLVCGVTRGSIPICRSLAAAIMRTSTLAAIPGASLARIATVTPTTVPGVGVGAKTWQTAERHR